MVKFLMAEKSQRICPSSKRDVDRWFNTEAGRNYLFLLFETRRDRDIRCGDIRRYFEHFVIGCEDRLPVWVAWGFSLFGFFLLSKLLAEATQQPA